MHETKNGLLVRIEFSDEATTTPEQLTDHLWQMDWAAGNAVSYMEIWQTLWGWDEKIPEQINGDEAE